MVAPAAAVHRESRLCRMSVIAPPAPPDPRAPGASTETAARDGLWGTFAGPVSFLAVLWLVLGAANAVWLARDRRPLAWDPAVHLISSLHYREGLLDLAHGRAGAAETVRKLLAVDEFYPPFVPFLGALLTLGRSPSASVSTWVVNQFFLALLILATFRLGRRVAGMPGGLAAAVAVVTIPGILAFSHGFWLDLPLAALTALAIDVLLASEDFSRTGASAWLGLVCGVGMLTKWTFLFFLAAPLAVAASRALRAADRARRFRNAAIGLAIAAAVSLPWYLAHAPNLAQDVAGFGGFTRGHWRRFPPVWSAASLTYNPRALGRLLLAPWLAVLTAGLALAWRNRPVRRLAFVSIPAVVLLTLLPAKDDRYVLPLLPVAAVLGTAWTGEAKRRVAWRIGVIAAAAGASLALTVRREPPSPVRWPIEDAVASLPAPRSSSMPPCVRVIPDTAEFHRYAFEYAALASGRDVQIAGDGHFPWFTDAVVVKTGEQGARPGPARTMAAIERGEGGFCTVFRRTWRDDLPDGSRGEIWIRDVRPVAGVAPAELVERVRTAALREIERRTRSSFRGSIAIETLSDEATRKGEFRRITVSAAELSFAGKRPGDAELRIRDFACDLEGITINPYRLLEDGDLEILSLEAVDPRLAISEDDVNSYLAARGGGASRVGFDADRIRVWIRETRLPSLELTLFPRVVGGSNVAIDFESLRLAGIPLPPWFVALLASQYNPILKQMPCRVRLGSVRCERGVLRVEAIGSRPAD
jgi:hypothetical protein